MNTDNLDIGLESTAESTVSPRDTAKEHGSGGLDVYATPAVIALMEKAALSAVEPHLSEGYATVGTKVSIDHISATPLGMKVRASAKLTGVEGKKLYFRIEAYDEVEKIAEGLHERYIINTERFTDKAYKKGNR